jgi:hypothetical protein
VARLTAVAPRDGAVAEDVVETASEPSADEDAEGRERGDRDERSDRGGRRVAWGEQLGGRERIAKRPDGGAPDGGAPAPSRTHPPAAPALDAPPKGTISVPAAVVAKAIRKRDVSARNATGAGGEPLGARVAGVSRYGTGLRDGDVVVFVAGARTRTVDAMTTAALSAVAAGAKRLRGKILRGGAIYAVVLEVPDLPAGPARGGHERRGH